MINEATVEVTEKDINESYNYLNRNSTINPLQIAASRFLKVDKERIEVKHNELLVWMYDDSDYVLYKYDDESYVKVYDFLNEWQLVSQSVEDGVPAKFEGDLISFNIEVDNDTRTHTNHWSGASVDFSGLTDESCSHKKDLKFRLTDDEY
tara:strand:+ start:1502 stop:1951 length:450 start_codon:yes stop_codon:yes gene_type:complete